MMRKGNDYFNSLNKKREISLFLPKLIELPISKSTNMKRELSLSLLLISLLVMCIAGCKKEQKEQEEINEVKLEQKLNVTENEVPSILKDIIVDNDINTALSVLAKELTNMDIVSSVEVNEYEIIITFVDGTSTFVVFQYLPSDESTGNPSRIQIDNPSQHNNLKLGDINKAYAATKKVVIWEPFAVETYGYGLGLDDDAQLIREAGFNVRHYTFNDCNVLSLQRLFDDDYDYVMFNTHGSTDGKWLATHERVTSTTEGDETYIRMKEDGYLATGTVHYFPAFSSSATVYFVSDEYIRSLEGEFNSSIVYAGMCHSMDQGGSLVCQAFHSKGAAAFVGYEGSMQLNYNNDVGYSFVERLVLEKLTVGEAYNRVHEQHPDAPELNDQGTILSSNMFRLFGESDPNAGLFVLPGVTTHPAENITNTSALLKGTIITDENCQDIIEKGFCYGTGPGMFYGHVGGDIIVYQGSETDDFSCVATDLYPEMLYYVRAYAKTTSGLISYGDEMSFTTLNGPGPGPGGEHEYVDLGLPSGTLWATCNVGANAPEEYGDYFAWGETLPKDYYEWSTYQYCMGSQNTLTKYCNNAEYGYNGFTDNLTTLLSEDDAATANWGSEWRMPTSEDWGELYDNITSIWTTQNGVNGRLFTAPNGNSLFLPAAGYRWNSDFHFVDDSGEYSASSLLTNYIPVGALTFYFSSNQLLMHGGGRCFGISVRPVRATSQVTSYVVNATPSPAEGGNIQISGGSHSGATCTLTATANEGYVFANWTENGTVVSTSATYSFTLTNNRTLVANFVQSGGGGHAYVDLGLPSGTLWATCNVGANVPEEYGDYFAWGETEPKAVYNASNYKYCNGSENALTKYCNDASYGYNGFTDNLTTLLPDDDAAAANWGNSWHTPTEVEWRELLNNTSITWTTQNGVNGRLFTASNGNSLFMPAAGFNSENGLNLDNYGGRYWSSSLELDNPSNAWNNSFYSGNCGMDSGRRAAGRSVRPVRSTR